MSITDTSEAKLIEIRLKLLLLPQQQLIKELAVAFITLFLVAILFLIIGIFTALLSVLTTILLIAIAAVIGKTVTMLIMTLVMLKLFVTKVKKSKRIALANFQTITITLQNSLSQIAPETWNKTCDSFLDTVEAFPSEKDRWRQRNLKFVAYLVVAWDLLGFFRYFTKTLISNAIATKKVSS